jgi:hypothetical protein
VATAQRCRQGGSDHHCLFEPFVNGSSSWNGCSPLPFWIPEEKQMVEYFQPKM